MADPIPVEAMTAEQAAAYERVRACCQFAADGIDLDAHARAVVEMAYPANSLIRDLPEVQRALVRQAKKGKGG